MKTFGKVLTASIGSAFMGISSISFVIGIVQALGLLTGSGVSALILAVCSRILGATIIEIVYPVLYSEKGKHESSN